MNFGEAMIAAVHGRLVRRPTWHGNWHARYFAPTDRDDQSPALWMAEGWPAAVHSYAPQFDGDDILADDWVIADPVAMIRCQAGEIIPCNDEEEDE